MKKALPILFVASTVVVTAASLTVATNGGFTQLRAADNSVQHTITFTVDDVVSVAESYVDKITINKKTESGFDFGCVISVDPGENGETFYVGNIVEMENDDGDASVSMTFQFHNVLSADSVTLNGYFEDSYSSSLTFPGSGGFNININLTYQYDVKITSIVVKYTCSY